MEHTTLTYLHFMCVNEKKSVRYCDKEILMFPKKKFIFHSLFLSKKTVNKTLISIQLRR